jgi:hypothetical protein
MAGHVAHVEMRNAYILNESQKGRDYSEDIGIDGRIILK